MKRFLAIFLVCVLMLSICACGNSKEEQGGKPDASNAALEVGFGKVKIMPTEPVWLAGGGQGFRVSTGFMDYLYSTCIAIRDADGQIALIFTEDLLGHYGYDKTGRNVVSGATGVPVSNIMFAGTHTHSAPGIYDGSAAGVSAYRKEYNAWIVEAAKAAIADLSPATVSIGTTEAEGMAFCRHYELDNGTYAGSQFGDFSSGNIVKHVHEGDEVVQLIRFTRPAEDKEDILLMNLGVHPTFNGSTSNTNLSADLPGPTRDYIEAQTGMKVAYFTSGAGNQSSTSRVQSETLYNDYQSYGEALGKIVIEALPGLQAVTGDQVRFNQRVLTLDVYKDKVEMLAEAKIVADAYEKGGYELSDPLVKQYGFITVFEANQIVVRAARQDKQNLELNALSIGDVSMIFAPYEMFAQSAIYIRDNSPDAMTFVVACANGVDMYFATEDAWDYNAYEAYSAVYGRGTAELVAENFVEMCKDLKNGTSQQTPAQ